jgi:6-phosphofructokinase 1
VLDDEEVGKSLLVAMKNNEIIRVDLATCLKRTRQVAAAVKANDFEQAMKLRGSSFRESFQVMRTLVRAQPHERAADRNGAAAGYCAWGRTLTRYEYGRSCGRPPRH